MFIGFPYCSFKCERDCGKEMCQNKPLAHSPIIDINVDSVVIRYINNNITKAIVLGGLEPLDSFDDVVELLKTLRQYTNDDFIVYSGYDEEEIFDKVELLKKYCNVIIKFGRYIPDEESHFDSLLGVNLASFNQYAKKIS